MIKKICIGVLAIVVVAFGYWTISPFFRNTEVEEAFPVAVHDTSLNDVASISKKIASGSFVGFDRIHNGKGEASIYKIGDKTFLRFEEGFMVNNGPDLYVGFGVNGEYVKGSELAKLKGNIGSQNYEIPDTVPLDSYDSVYVWCKAFSTPFVRALLVRE